MDPRLPHTRCTGAFHPTRAVRPRCPGHFAVPRRSHPCFRFGGVLWQIERLEPMVPLHALTGQEGSHDATLPTARMMRTATRSDPLAGFFCVTQAPPPSARCRRLPGIVTHQWGRWAVTLDPPATAPQRTGGSPPCGLPEDFCDSQPPHLEWESHTALPGIKASGASH
jgi:hypothetical protein